MTITFSRRCRLNLKVMNTRLEIYSLLVRCTTYRSKWETWLLLSKKTLNLWTQVFLHSFAPSIQPWNSSSNLSLHLLLSSLLPISTRPRNLNKLAATRSEASAGIHSPVANWKCWAQLGQQVNPMNSCSQGSSGPGTAALWYRQTTTRRERERCRSLKKLRRPFKSKDNSNSSNQIGEIYPVPVP